MEKKSADVATSGSLAGIQWIDNAVAQNGSGGGVSVLNERSRAWVQSSGRPEFKRDVGNRHGVQKWRSLCWKLDENGIANKIALDCKE